MEQEKTAELEAEKQASEQDTNLDEKDTQKTDTQTVEDAEGGDDEKQEESPFKAELDKLNIELEKKNDIIEKKNRAIEALKKKKEEKKEEVDESETTDKDSLKQEIIQEYRRERELEKFSDLLSAFTEDKVEKELIQKIYENRIVKTGNVVEDFKTSVAIAHKDVVLRSREEELEREADEERQSFSMIGNMRSNNKSKNINPVNREAAKLLRAIGVPEAIKKLK